MIAGGRMAVGWAPLPPERVVALLEGFPGRWWLAGGWALDLFLGHGTRPHADIDVGVLRRDAGALHRQLETWQLWQTQPLRALRRWEAGEPLPGEVHSQWCRPADHAPWSLEVNVEEADGDRWRFRRHPTVTLPLGRLVRRSAQGWPYLTPEVALLYKAKSLRDKDHADFAHVAPHLDDDARQWLAEAIAVTHPRHPWLAALLSGDDAG